jgi:hypothetical protein
MSSLFQKTAELSADAKLASRIGPAGLVALKSTGLSSTTTMKADTFLKDNWLKIQSSVKSIPTFFQKPFSMGKIIFYSLIFILLVIVSIYVYKRVFKTEGFEDSSIAQQKAFTLVNSIKIDRNISVNEDDNKLVNIQPIVFKQAAYLGDEMFDDDLGILEQLRAGSRFFFLQIDYFEKDLGKSFGKAYEPVLVWRNDAGRMTSKNSASLTNIALSIKKYYNNDNVPNHNSPIVIFLHFVRTPYGLTDIDNYRSYLNKVSESLSTLDSILIKGYAKASKESDLFSTTFTQFNKQIIIGTNIDTRSLNNPLNLDKYVHFMYNDTSEDPIDISDRKSDKTNALIYSTDYLLSITDSNEIQKFIKTNRNKFIIAKPKNDKILRKEDIDTLLKKLNVNVVLHDYFSESAENISSIYNLYNNSSYKLKTTF